jgi:hypothetical protein
MHRHPFDLPRKWQGQTHIPWLRQRRSSQYAQAHPGPFRGEVILKEVPEALCLLGSREFGTSRALLILADELGLSRSIYSRREPWVRDYFTMIVGRVIYAGSKLSLSHQ